MSRSGTALLAVALLALALMAGVPAHAQSVTGAFKDFSGHSKAPVKIEADRLEVRESDHDAIFTGKVVVLQGQSTLRAKKLTIEYAEPGKPGAPASQAAGQDDAAAQQRALEEAQSRTAELEKNVADLQKLLELKNQQLAELEKKASAKPAPAVPQAAAPQPSAPQPPTAAAEKPAVALAGQATAPSAPPAQAMAPSQSAAPATPAAVEPPAQAAPSHAQAPQPAPAAKPAAPKPAVKPKPRPAPPPEPSLVDEFLDNPLYLAGLGLVVLLLAAYAAFSWRRKKAAHAKFQDSVMGAAAAGGGVAALHESTAPAASVSQAPVSQAPAGMEPEEVDPIAEADVYMAYGRDAQAEEILREALQKDSSRAAVHAKLLEIYANRKDAKAFEQTALKLKNLTSGSGPEWEKAAALGRAIDPQNSVYGDVAAAPVAVPAAAAAAPVLDFDLGGGSQGGPAAPDISLDEPVKDVTASNVDFELGATNTLKLDQQSPDSTVAVPVAGHPETGGLDFNLDLGGPEEKPAAEAQPAEEPSGLDFNLDLGEAKSDAVGSTPQPGAAPALDLGDISLDLGTPAAETAVATAVSADPKWQEVATKLDLAKAYEEMGDKDGARELLNEVMKDGDTAQKGQAQQILAKLA
jgi:pilus assembly protein FimV